MQSSFKLFKRFFKEARQAKAAYGESFPFLASFKFWPQWKRTHTTGKGPLEDEIPWITFAATEFLEGWVKPSMKVFEYGSGGSTLFFAKRAREVVTVDHDPEWADRVRTRLAEKGLNNASVTSIPSEPDPQALAADPSDAHACTSTAEEHRGRSFTKYVHRLQNYPKDHFDLILVDGRARPSCFALAATLIAPGGLIVYDNMERDYYWPVTLPVKDRFQMLDLPSPTPYCRGFTRTVLWRCTKA